MEFTSILAQLNWPVVLVVGVLLWGWLYFGQSLISNRYQAIDGGVRTHDKARMRVADLISQLLLTVLTTAVLATIQHRQAVRDAVGAALVGALIALIPVAVRVGEASRDGTLRTRSAGFALAFGSLIGCSVLLFEIHV